MREESLSKFWSGHGPTGPTGSAGPAETLAYLQSIVIGGAVLVAAWNSHDVLMYETGSDQWSVLPSCPVLGFGLGQLSGKLVTVGGVCGRLTLDMCIV